MLMHVVASFTLTQARSARGPCKCLSCLPLPSTEGRELCQLGYLCMLSGCSHEDRCHVRRFSKTAGHGGGLQVSEAEQARLLEGIAEQLYTELAAHIPRDAATPAGDHAAAIAVRICSWMQDRGVRVGLGSERKPMVSTILIADNTDHCHCWKYVDQFTLQPLSPGHCHAVPKRISTPLAVGVTKPSDLTVCDLAIVLAVRQPFCSCMHVQQLRLLNADCIVMNLSTDLKLPASPWNTLASSLHL